MKYLKVILFTLILATICGIFLTGINAFTRTRIIKYEEFILRSSVLEALGVNYSRGNIDEVFRKNVFAEKAGENIFYRTKDGAVAFEIRGSGLWGPIHGLVAMEPDFSTIRRLLILHQEETPGLGGRIGEDEFLSQFRGKTMLPGLVFLPHGKARASNEVDAITGATGSSRALEKLINENVKKILPLIKDIGK